MPPAIAAVAVGVAAGVAASSVVVGIAVAIGTVALQNSLKPDMPGVDESAREAQTLTTEPLQPRRGIYGECVVSGSIVGYGKRKLGDKEAHVVAVTLAGHNIEAAELYEVNGKTKPSGTTTEIFKGGQSSASATLLQYADGWTEDHIGFGLSYAVVTIPIDPEEMPSGLQNITFKVKGKRVYDPRKDTMVGGDGPHRANDETTWEWSDNTILCAFDYQRFHGYKLLGLNKFDLPHIMEQANICDELVSYIDSDGEEQTEKRFTCNGSWTFDQSPSRVLERLMSSCGGQPYRRGGKMYLQTASYHGMAEITLTDTDAAGEITITPHRELKDRTNTVRAAFQNPKKGYQPTDAPVVTNSIYVDRDGMELEDELQLNFTNSSTMAQRLMKYHLERNRAGMRLEFPCKSKGLLALAGTTVRVDLPNEGINKEFIVSDWQFDFKAKKTKLILEEESPELYSDSLVPSEGNVTPNTELPDLTRPEPPESLSFTLDPISTHRQGYVTWSHPIPRAVTEYRVVIRKDGDNIVEYPVIARSGAQLRQDINGLDAGQYSLEIYARNRYDRTSLPATISLTLNIPSPPTNLGITAGNWEVTSAPVLTGVGLGTVFEFAFEEVTNIIGLGMTIVKPGLKPATDYTLFARTVNPLGKSGWVSQDFTTTDHDEQLSPWLQGIREELDAVDLVIDNWDSWNPAREVSEQLTSIFSDYKRQEDSRVTLEVAKDAGLAADGALEAVNGIKASINDPETGLEAAFSMAQSARVTADGTAESVTSIASGITGLEDSAEAILQMKSYVNEGGLAARAFLGTDAYGRVTGMTIGDDGVTRQVQFTADSIAFTDGDGQLMVYYDLDQGRYVYDGHIVARSGLFAGELQAASGTFTGALQAATGTFKGDLQAAGGTFSGNLEAANGTFAGVLQAAAGTFTGTLVAASGSFSGDISGASGTFEGTVKAENLIGDVNNIKSITPPYSGTWYLDTNNSGPASYKRICTLTLPAASYTRSVRVTNLVIGFKRVSLSSGAGALATVQARRSNGAVLNSWRLGVGVNGNKAVAGYETPIGNTDYQTLDFMRLPAGETTIRFYMEVDETTGTIAFDYGAWTPTSNDFTVVEIQTAVVGSSFGASIS